eukprot:4418333-Pyramimonas_sp.AAC.1
MEDFSTPSISCNGHARASQSSHARAHRMACPIKANADDEFARACPATSTTRLATTTWIFIWRS